MKLVEILEKSITEGDWSLLCGLYKTLTGKDIKPPKQSSQPSLLDMDISLIDTPLTPLQDTRISTQNFMPKKKGRASKEEVEFINEHMPSMTDEQIAESLNRTVKFVKKIYTENTDVGKKKIVTHKKKVSRTGLSDKAGIDIRKFFTDSSDGEQDDRLADSLVQKDGEQPGEELTDGEADIAKDSRFAGFIAPTKGQKQPQSDGQAPARKQKMVIPSQGERLNRFQDDPERVLVHERVDVNKLGGVRPQPRGKLERAQKIDVVCSLCSTPDKIMPSEARGYSPNKDDNTYKCNNCCTTRGRKNLEDVD
jgi:hypothetical protein